jgi:hypothetical protein
MGWDDEDDDWPEPERDPVKLEERRVAIRQIIGGANKAALIVYVSLGMLVVLVLVLAYLAT